MSMTFENTTTKSVDVNGTNFVFREIGKKGGAAWRRSTTLLCSTIVGSADPEVLPPKRSRRWLGMPSLS